MPSEGPKRFLFLIHTPWSRDLGAPRVQLELGEELETLGCTWTKFSRENAFPARATFKGRLARWAWGIADQNRSFARRAIEYARSNAHRFDVIEAHQTDLPRSKASLGFSGLLVTRSVGFLPAYKAFDRYAATRWPQKRSARTRIEAALTSPARWRRERDLAPSLAFADLITVANRDELRTLSDDWGLGKKTVHIPIGMPSGRLRDFRTAARDRPRRSTPTVAFVGTWNDRKGAYDWPLLVPAILERVPSARFLFLGGSLPEEQVLAGFDRGREAIRVVPSYRSEELPVLLRGATAAAFPGYLEGFGISVVETLAAGLPTVVYDAPGPRDIVAGLQRPRKVALGDTEAMAEEVSRVLLADEAAWASESEDAMRAAAGFDNHEIARRTLRLYTEHWQRLKR